MMTQKKKRLSKFTESLVPSNIPKDWKLAAVGTLLSHTEYGLSEPGDSEGNTPIVGMKDLVAGKVVFSDLATINGEGIDLDKLRLHKGDILLNRTNSPDLVGKVAIVREEARAVFASYLVRLAVKEEAVDAGFLNEWLNGEIAQRAIKRIATRAVSQANVNPTEFKKYCPVLLPSSSSEQQRIAALLRCWNDAIEIQDSMIEQANHLHTFLVRSLVFGESQLVSGSARTKKKYRWFTLPIDWGCERIANLACEVTERHRHTESPEILSCSKYDGFVRSLDYFKKQVFSSDLSGYKRIYRGDFGFPSNHVEEGSIGLQNITDVGLVSPIYIVFRFLNDRIDNEYAHYVLKTKLYRHIFEVSTSASVDRRGSLRWNEFAAIPFPIPPLHEQREIVRILHTSTERITLLHAQKALIEEQKRGLMQKLLTGEWRLPC